MKTIFSNLAEKQTVRTDKVNSRIAIRVRQIMHGDETRDVMVDGYVYTPAVSEAWVAKSIAAIVEIVASKADYLHLGHGEWISNQAWAQ